MAAFTRLAERTKKEKVGVIRDALNHYENSLNDQRRHGKGGLGEHT